MGNRVFLPFDPREMQELSDETGFSVQQLGELCQRYCEITKCEGKLTREHLLQIPELSKNPLCDRIIVTLFPPSQESLSFPDYVRQLKIFRHSSDGSDRDEKIRFLYELIDQNGDGSITVAELAAFLQLLIGDHMPIDQINSIALRCISEADDDNDHQIDFEEFKKTLKAVEIEKMNLTALRR